MPLVTELVDLMRARIDDGLLPEGERAPSIRAFATERGVSRFTVVHAYERLVAMGYLESRRGSGFYARRRPALETPHRRDGRNKTVDRSWLVWNQFGNTVARANMPGSALLPGNWLDAGMLAANLRAIGRQNLGTMLHYGPPAGFLPLRVQLQLKLAEAEIAAKPDQIVLTSGVTQAIDLICGAFLVPGDAVLVEDPAWYRIFATLSERGLKVIGIPRRADGPDFEAVEAHAAQHRPKFLFLNSVLQNPTGTSISAAKAHAILQAASRHGFTVVETDVFSDFHGGHVSRLATLDQLRRVIYISSFSKTLSATLRVGYIACEASLASVLVEQKLKTCLTTSEIAERLVHKVLSDGHYRRHVARIRNRVAAVRESAIRKLEGIGMRIPTPPLYGVLAWADTGMDSDVIASEGLAKGLVFAPGRLFTPHLAPSTWMRFNLATSASPHILSFLAQRLGRR